MTGPVSAVGAATRSRDLVAIGAVHRDGTDPRQERSGVIPARVMAVRLVIPASIRRAGHGPMTFEWTDDDVSIVSGTTVWVVTTNKGWVHLRGFAQTSDPAVRLPFRADLFAAASVGVPGPDRLALRFYAIGDDPNVGSPISKVYGWLDPGSITFLAEGDRIAPKS